MAESVVIISGTNKKPVASSELVQYFSDQPGLDGHLLIGYPIIGTPEGKHAIDAIWISPTHGIVLFDLVEGRDPGSYSLRQDDAANKVEARLKTHRELMDRRNLRIEVHTITFAPGVHDLERFQDAPYHLTNATNLYPIIQSLDWRNNDARIYEIALSAIQNISTIRSAKSKRAIADPDSKGAKLKNLEDSIATLDNRQGQAVIATVEGVQRIRGLAGSGKTIVLALKAAYLHAQHPEWKIAVTFNTRSLKGQFKRLINNFSIEQGEEPDWDNLTIFSAWGAPGGSQREGLYYKFCKTHGLEYSDYGTAKDAYGDKAFATVCDNALAEVGANPAPIYDVILVDEAQDFPPSFLRLCYAALSEPKRLVYAYDELQNLSHESLPPAEEIFGRKEDGSPLVRIGAEREDLGQDIILSKCYRNSRPVLVTAHALGFGIYRTPPKPGMSGLVQMFDDPNLWKEIGYRVEEGELREGANVTLLRPAETSPRFLEDHSDDLVEFQCFSTEEEQADWVASQIAINLNDDELRPDDIVVINPNPLTTRKKVGPIRRRLLDMGIQTHTAGVDTSPDIFFQPTGDSITFTGIHRAKGNEAGMVYVINAHDCNSSFHNLATIRNRLFTAITRSKAWVRILGVGPEMEAIMDEAQEAYEHKYKLKFIYPTEKQREQLKIVHREVPPNEQRLIEQRERGLLDYLEDVETGRLHFEDLSEEVREKLESLAKRAL